MNFLETITERPLVADGAMGTMINSRGIGFERSFESLNIANPEVILSIHREFVAAGADLIETNTFSATPNHLDRWGAASKCVEINAVGVRLAREAADEVPRRVFVGGSIGPTGSRLAPTGPLSVDEARRPIASRLKRSLMVASICWSSKRLPISGA